MAISVEVEALRTEASKWFELAEEMSEIRMATAGLSLGMTAFFIGDLTEHLHWSAYRRFHSTIVGRLKGATIEFELIGTALRNIATDYESGDLITSDHFRVTQEELEQATDAHAPPAHSGGGTPAEFD